MSSFDFSRPIAVLAPHLILPARNGADLLVERSALHLSRHCPSVTVLGAESVIRYEGGRVEQRDSTGITMRPRIWAALLTVAKRSHYFREKFLTGAYCRAARSLVKSGSFGGVICSYLTTLEAVRGCNVPAAAWTHNDEFRWFADLDHSSKGPASLVAKSSLAYLSRHASSLAATATLVHVSELDRAGFSNKIGAHESVVVPIGTDGHVNTAPLSAGAAPQLLFVGSLSVNMNADALDHFGSMFAPQLLIDVPQLSVVVCGSSPSARVRKLCEENSWELRADVDDDEIDEIYSTCTFAILPFPYSTGSKLKLLAALAHGVPVLATTTVNIATELLVSPSIQSNDPADWSTAIQETALSGLTQRQRIAISAPAEPFSWERSAERMVEYLNV